jgi:hypothetical protein
VQILSNALPRLRDLRGPIIADYMWLRVRLAPDRPDFDSRPHDRDRRHALRSSGHLNPKLPLGGWDGCPQVGGCPEGKVFLSGAPVSAESRAASSDE